MIFLALLLYIAVSTPGEDLDNLERVLREIAIDNTTETKQLNITGQSLILNSTNETQSDDPEADKFIEYLKNLTVTNGVKNEYHQKDELGVPHEEIHTPKNTSDTFYNETLTTHPELMFVTKLNGSSFRIKMVLNKTWSKDMLYPSNYEYAILENSLTKEFNKAYEHNEDYLNFHLLSFNYRNKDSFYCDFILNFKTKNRHLRPFLELILKGKIDDIPLSLENLTAYVIEINPASIDSCRAACDRQKCLDRLCPPECCPNITKNTSENLNITSISKNAPENISEISDWGLNSSQIQEEVFKIIQGLSMNDTMIDDRTIANSRIPDYQNIQSQPESEKKFAFEQNANRQNDYYASIVSNSMYQYPQSSFQQNYDSGSALQPQNTIYKNEDTSMLDKRWKIPETPSMVQPNIPNSNFIDQNIKYDHKNNQIRNRVEPVIYFPKTSNSYNFAPENARSRKSELKNGNVRIWYPKI